MLFKCISKQRSVTGSVSCPGVDTHQRFGMVISFHQQASQDAKPIRISVMSQDQDSTLPSVGLLYIHLKVHICQNPSNMYRQAVRFTYAKRVLILGRNNERKQVASWSHFHIEMTFFV